MRGIGEDGGRGAEGREPLAPAARGRLFAPEYPRLHLYGPCRRGTERPHRDKVPRRAWPHHRPRRNVCGDDPYILAFSERYPSVAAVPLEDNFRSSEGIVRTAQAFIEKVDKPLPKAMRTTRAQVCEPATSDDDFLEDVRREIRRAAGALREGALGPAPAKGKCEACDYRGLCRRGE